MAGEQCLSGVRAFHELPDLHARIGHDLDERVIGGASGPGEQFKHAMNDAAGADGNDASSMYSQAGSSRGTGELRVCQRVWNPEREFGAPGGSRKIDPLGKNAFAAERHEIIPPISGMDPGSL